MSCIRHVIRTLFFTLLVLNPVWADDVEIFFNTPDTTTRPNLLFVLDGSGSMGRYDCRNGGSSRTPCNDGTVNGSTTRLKRMVDALTEVFNTTKDVNIGLMRFSHAENGGRVIYPIRDIDDQICNGVSCTEDSVFTVPVSSANDDLYEDNTGKVITDDTILPLNRYDGDQHSRVSALRFSDLRIPQGATITQAHILFQSASDSMINADLRFKIEDTSNSIPFEPGLNNITNRQWSPDSVPWNAVEPWSVDSTYESPDLSDFVNRVVNKSDWCGGNSVSFSIEGSGDRLASAFERSDQTVPVLKVKYRLDNVPDTGGCMLAPLATGLIQSNQADVVERVTGNNWGWTVDRKGRITTNALQLVTTDYMSGFSFTDLNIPQGAKIKSAKVVLSTHTGVGSQVTNISLEASANPSAFNFSLYDLSRRPKLPTIPWTNTMTGISDVISSEAISDTLTTHIQAIVNHPNWAPTNRINLFMQRSYGNNRAFHSYESDVDKTARLEIEYYDKVRVSEVRTALINELAEFKDSGGTPTVGALLEARRYFAGEPVNYGKKRGNERVSSVRYSRVSHQDSYTGGEQFTPAGCGFDLNSQHCVEERIDEEPVYTSPIEHECQANHIILLTDGDPNETGSAAKVEAQNLVGGTCAFTNSDQEGFCGAEVAGLMFGNENDENQGDAGDPHDLHPDFNGRQNLTVHTIGFNLDHEWLESVADAGGGDYHTADSAADLVTAIGKITAKVEKVDTTFVAPGATVDQFSRLSHRKDIYLALFRPDKRAGWQGNLKKYEIKGSPPRIFDANENEAVDIDNGVFRNSAQSFWSISPDGNNVLLGGAAALLEPSDRNLVSYFGSNTELFSATNEITVDNPFITEELFNAESDVELEKMVDWLYGFDVLDEDDNDITYRRQHLGDPLHSQPQLITYGGTQEDPDSMVVFGTNDGFLHGINTRDGEEVFAFMPDSLFANLKRLYNNNQIATSDERVYGMDGDLTLWVKEENNNGIVDEDDTVYLYAGMRRGGRDYWVLDLSDRDNPKYKAHIAGGQGNFIELGETWSKPTLARVNIGGDIRQVLIFAGGYDNSQDDKDTRIEDTVGRAIYIVDAENPTDILWSGSGNPQAASYSNTEHFENMRYSIPSDVLVVKEGSEQLASQIYVGDMGGQIWRFDVSNGADEGSELVDGGVIADLSDDEQEKATRRFYFPPDLSLSIIDNKQYLNIAIGSGYEAHPLDTTIVDHFFVIRYPYKATGNYGIKDPWDNTYRSINIYDLFDATDNTIGESNNAVEVDNALEELRLSAGWRIKMPRSGEKILGASTTLDSVVRFVTYVPAQGEGHNGCLPDIGKSFYWSVNLSDGTPSGSEDSVANNRYREIPSPGRAPPVQVLFTTSDDSATITPTDVSGINVLNEGKGGSDTRRWYWAEYPE